MKSPVFDPQIWSAVPFFVWGAVFLVFGCMVGSFLNVCIHRMPRGESIVSPPSHCPHCNYSIPWFLNIPILTWLWLRGRCANCREPISVRYLIVEALTGLLFLAMWLRVGVAREPATLLLALAYCTLLAGFIVATCVDFEHFIIPDEITLGGIGAGLLLSAAVPALHGTTSRPAAMERSFWGIVVGAGIVYAILRLGKLAFGRQQYEFPPDTTIVFTETSLHLPQQEVPYEDLFYRKSDTVQLHARRVELIDRCYANVDLRLTQTELRLGEDSFAPDTIPHMEVVTDRMEVPREAMGLGDVKFMGAIGAFLGWPAVIFSLMCSSIIGAGVGVSLIALRKREWSSRLPYGPYIALAATFWAFAPESLRQLWTGNLVQLWQIVTGSAAAVPRR